MITESDINNWFIYHVPNEEQIRKYQLIRDTGKEVAWCIFQKESNEIILNYLDVLKVIIINNCPNSDEKDYAINNLDNLVLLLQARADYLNFENNIKYIYLYLRLNIIMAANAAIACNS